VSSLNKTSPEQPTHHSNGQGAHPGILSGFAATGSKHSSTIHQQHTPLMTFDQLIASPQKSTLITQGSNKKPTSTLLDMTEQPNLYPHQIILNNQNNVRPLNPVQSRP
jgi:hypothetical protein